MELAEIFDNKREDFLTDIHTLYEFLASFGENNFETQDYEYWDFEFVNNSENFNIFPNVIEYESFIDFAANYEIQEFFFDDNEQIQHEGILVAKDDMEMKDEIFPFLTVYLFETYNSFFLPLASYEAMDIILHNAREMGVNVPELPGEDDYLATVSFYWEFCGVVMDWMIKNGISQADACAGLYK